jgi:hypothetical protein
VIDTKPRGWVYIPSRGNEAVIEWLKVLILSLVVLFVLLMLNSCSYVNYTGRSDGSTEMSGFEIGSKTALDGAKVSIDKQGRRSLQISGYSQDLVEGLKQVNSGLSLLVEGLAKGAAP